MHLHAYWKRLKMQKKGEAKLMQIHRVKYEYTHRKHWLVVGTSQLLTLHQHRANNQYRTANQI